MQFNNVHYYLSHISTTSVLTVNQPGLADSPKVACPPLVQEQNLWGLKAARVFAQRIPVAQPIVSKHSCYLSTMASVIRDSGLASYRRPNIAGGKYRTSALRTLDTPSPCHREHLPQT